MSDATGDLFEANSVVAHRYRVIRYRGDRGFGQVYEAEDSALGRSVALMRLSREFSRPDARESFYETRSTAAVEDPRIVDLADYGEDVDGRLFLVMPWVDEAEGLDELIAREGALAWPRVKHIVEQIAGALEAAHAKGVLHGGLEPRRVLIDPRDGVHIVDFGLAPALTQTSGREITLSGPLPGKIEYLSPEQVRGESVDSRSDIYALGAILWELIGGAPPFTGDPVAVAEAHLSAPLPELPRRGPNKASWAPAEVEPLLHLALTKDPDERLASASEFSALLAAMPGGGAPSPTARVATTPLAPAVAPPAPPVAKPPAAKPPAPPVAASTKPAPAPAQPEHVAASPAGPEVVVAPEPRPEPKRSATPPARKRRLGKLELAILIFLGFDVLVFVGWKLFGTHSSDAAPVAAADESPSQPEATDPPPPVAEPSPAEPEPEPDPEPEPEALSVEEAIASEFPPEPDTPGPVRPMAKSLSDKAFREAMVAARDTTLQKCTDSRMRRTLKISLKVAPSGKVEYARVVGNLAETALGQCVVKQIYKIEFPPTYEGGSHTYTLRLR